MTKAIVKAIVLVSVLTAVALFFALGLDKYITLEFIKQQYASLTQFYDIYPLQTLIIYGLGYIIITGLSLPGAAVLTLAAGAFFGFVPGLIMVSFASTIGATIAFIIARLLVGDYIQEKYGDKLKAINEGVKKDGAFYLFSIRLVPLFPFFIVNMVMGLTKIRILTFYIISQLGMLPGTAVYVYAGTELAKIDTLGGIVSPGIIFAFTLLAIFPLIARKVVAALKEHKILRKFKKPRKFDYNVIVIGAGAGGLVSSYIAAAVKAKVALIEKHKMGGDCLNTGCVPSKALIRTAKIITYAKRAKDFGLKKADVDFDFQDVMKRVHKIIRKIEPHDSVERYTKLGVKCIQGEAKLLDPYRVRVNGRTLTARSIILATGASPLVPPIPGLDKIDYLTSDTLWDLKKLPKRLVVLGGGPIGCELAQSFARLGSKVTIVEMLPQLLIKEDKEVSRAITKKFKAEGITVLTGHMAKSFTKRGNAKTLVCEAKGKDAVKVPFDEIVLALGRKANTKGYGLEELGVTIAPQGTIEADPFLRTNYPNIYVCGDVTGPYQFTHTAGHQAWYASVNALFSPFKRFKADYSVIPWATFTDPEVARVGLSEKDAIEQGIEFEATTYGIDDLDRAIADSEDHGFVKVITPKGNDKILGVTIVGSHAGDLIAEFILAMKYGIGLNKILGTIHIYQTLAESNKYVSGEWKRAHVPHKALKWAERFHRWRRGG